MTLFCHCHCFACMQLQRGGSKSNDASSIKAKVSCWWVLWNILWDQTLKTLLCCVCRWPWLSINLSHFKWLTVRKDSGSLWLKISCKKSVIPFFFSILWCSCQAWQLFQEGSLLQHLRHYLQLGDLHKAGFIWSRHSVCSSVIYTVWWSLPHGRKLNISVMQG